MISRVNYAMVLTDQFLTAILADLTERIIDVGDFSGGISDRDNGMLIDCKLVIIEIVKGVVQCLVCFFLFL